MDTDKELFVWVTQVELRESPNSCFLQGATFDGEKGFGDEEARSFEGDMQMVSQNGRSQLQGQLTVMHVSGKGIGWHLHAGDFIETPFLLTSNLNMVFEYEGTIDFVPSADSVEIYEKYGLNTNFPIISNNWLGMFNYTSEDSGKVNCFSDAKSRPMKGEKILFSDWEVELGTLR